MHIYIPELSKYFLFLTLIYPFSPESEFDTLIPLSNAICKHIQPFEISLTSFNYFTNRKQNFTIWLQPEPTKLIIKLQKRIQKIVPNCNDVNLHRNGYAPHLSLGQIKNKNTLMETINNFKRNWTPQSFLLDRIYFIAREQGKNSSFEEKIVIKFSSSLKL